MGMEKSSKELQSKAPKKKMYVKPAFQHEKVFETMALACGKLTSTQSQCSHNKKLS